MAGKNLKVKTVFTAIDDMSAKMGKIEKNTAIFSKKIQKELRKTRKASKGLGISFKGLIGAALGFRAISFGVNQIKEAIQAGAQFEKTLDGVAAKFGNIEKGSKAYKDLEEAARSVGAATEFSAQQAAEGLDFLAMAGFDATQSMAAIPQVVDLATAANIDLATATDMASDSLGAFNLMTKDSVKLTENLGRVNDVMAKTVTSANTNMEQLFESFTAVGPVATKLGASLETVATLTAKLADAGIKGSKAGRQLKNVFLSLAAPTAGGAAALAEMGVRTKDARGNMRDITDIIEDLRKKTSKLGTAARAAKLNAIFGKIPIAGMNVLLSVGGKELKRYRKSLIESGGAAKIMAEKMRKNLAGSFATLTSKIADVKITVFKVLTPILTTLVQKAIQLVGAFGELFKGSENLAKSRMTKIFSTLGKIFKGIVKIVGQLFSLFRDVISTIIEIAVTSGTFKVVQDIILGVVQVAGTLLTTLRDIWDILKDSGALEPVMIVFKAIGFIFTGWLKLINLLIPAFKFVIAAVISKFQPLIDLIKWIMKKIGEIIDFFSEDEEQKRVATFSLPESSEDGEIDDTDLVPLSKRNSPEEVAKTFKGLIRETTVDINFDNIPTGTQIKSSGDSGVNINIGRQQALAPAGG